LLPGRKTQERSLYPLPEKKLQKLFKEAAQKAGVEGITLYQASRHSFAMQLLDQGFSYEQVGAALGHADPHTTRRYARLRAEMVSSVFSAKQKIVPISKARSRKRKRNS